MLNELQIYTVYLNANWVKSVKIMRYFLGEYRILVSVVSRPYIKCFVQERSFG